MFIFYNLIIHGKINQVIINPPIKKQMVETNEGHCKLESPIIECPDVQPSAYLVPKPTKKPPMIINIKPFNESNDWKLNISDGTKPE